MVGLENYSRQRYDRHELAYPQSVCAYARMVADGFSVLQIDAMEISV